MSAREHLAQVLEGTGLYELTGASPVDWELAAYGAGFALLEERFDQLLGDLFPATASREKLAQWEALFRPQRARASLEDCREMVQCRLAIQRDGFTPPDVQALLPGAGVRGLLLEGESGLTVVLGRLLGVTQAEAQRELDQLLPEADIVALSLPGGDGTRGILGEKQIGLMKEGALLLNVGRGNAVDTDALTRALEAGHLRGAALDVTDPEPLPAGHPLWHQPRAVITPHVSGGFHMRDVYEKLVVRCTRNIAAFTQGRPLESVVDRSTGYTVSHG